MKAYLNNPKLKVHVLDQLEQHRLADRLIQGDYWKNGKGCAIGCTLESVRVFNGHDDAEIEHDQHMLYESELGIPVIVARLEDLFFERLDKVWSQAWPERFSRAISVGADLSMVWPRFALWLLVDEVEKCTTDQQALDAIRGVADLYREWVVSGTKPAILRWDAASAAYDAAAAAGSASAASASYAAAAAAAAAYAAAAAAAYSAYSAGAAAAASAAVAADNGTDTDADYAAYIRMSDKLIQLLSECEPN